MSSVYRRWSLALLVTSVLLFFFIALDSMLADSPTMDEQNHIARGLAFLGSGDPRFSVEHPPLVNLLSALPVFGLTDVQIPYNHPSWSHPEGWYSFAEELLWIRNRELVDQIIFLGRLPVVFMTLGLALIGYRLSKLLWGSAGAMLVLFLLLFDPNILAHGRYSTTDVGGALFMLASLVTVWHLFRYRAWPWTRLIAAGLAIGLALSSKMSNLVFVPGFALLACLPLYGGWSVSTVASRLGKLALSGAMAALVLWATYGFDVGPLQFQSPNLAQFNGIVAPMPPYWFGIEQIARISGGGRAAFLLGQFSADGFWYYFPVAFVAKTPLVSLIGFGVVVALLTIRQSLRRRALFLLLPAVLYFVVSMQSGLNIGYRHILPTLVLLYVAAGSLLTSSLQTGPRRSAPSVLAVFWAVVLLSGTMLLHPHYLSQFNLLVGGPANGQNVLIDSNIDWGQDLIRLSDWMGHNDVERLNLSWFGTADPGYYGVDYTPLPGLPRHFELWWDVPFDPEQPAPGVYAISVSNLWELPLEDKRVFPWFRAREADDRVGYSILIYRVNDRAGTD
ncbi:MAG: phospholipid carrier-dependent glycosyltransferase [Candidatus Promineifilaceae bacterium]|nr:phospholipid carrier-dependent glycosyltransferase [Candidatus Promineifilaceae bacterium]